LNIVCTRKGDALYPGRQWRKEYRVSGKGVKEGAGSPSNASVCPLRTSRGDPSSSLFFGLKNRG